ncbi:MAG: DNA polymerase III subunit gamma/tau [Lachnospiraceae bacterium]|jgi:DNA polymerase-3 subunit gamma/tau|nr:DNA polymerase III subunit gamma/tau [Lachnospiraceae bacterium]MDD4524315.1 DNA polymerase III subunit gamma/tau [Lachnospiraceae bacterium]
MSDQSYLALYRKYRPQTFDDVRGRDTIVRTLKNQIISGHTSHSYLFCGTRGTGKTTIAKIFARAVNCEHPVDGNPCGECESCRAIAGNADLNVVEMDAASNNGVDDIRAIIDTVGYSPTLGRKRVFIIDEVHMLSTPAFNALLKTLEEPPEYAVFILCTTEPNKLPITILSRCQRYDFGRLSTETIEGRLKEVAASEKLSVEERALHYIAGAADGSMRDGLSLLDQCNAFNYGNEILTYDRTLEILGAVDTSVFSAFYKMMHTGDAAGALSKLDELLMQGRELTQFVTDLIWYLRSLMLLKASEKTAGDLDVSKENLQLMLSDERDSEMPEILRDIRVFSALMEQIRYSANRRILTEAAIIRVCRPEADTDHDAILGRLHELESNVCKDERIISDLQAKLDRAARDGIRPAGSGDARTVNGNTAMAPSQNASRSTPPKVIPAAAVPEDIRTVVREWTKIISAIEDSFTKSCLKTAELSLSDDGQKLELVFPCEMNKRLISDNKGNRDRLESKLTEITGKVIPVEYKCLDSGENFNDNHIDLSKVVTMDIDVDDDV